MNKKILIISSDQKEKEKIEKIFEDVIEKGGELIFTSKKDDFLALLKKEHPDLVFVDSDMIENDALGDTEEMHVVWIRKKGEQQIEGQDTLFKPFTTQEVIGKCRQVLDLAHWEKVNPFPL